LQEQVVLVMVAPAEKSRSDDDASGERSRLEGMVLRGRDKTLGLHWRLI
jgi:hypothetical protein